jgi:O-antigen ligase
MPPSLALLIWFILLVALFWFDPAKDEKASVALWIPVTWLSFVGSRSPSLWLGVRHDASAAAALEEGNLVDRVIFSLLLLLAIAILVSRGFQWGEFFARNAALMAFLAFALFSVAWSDFPFVTFKKWFRDLGGYAVVLVALSDPRPLESLRTVLRRVCYLLIPLSMVLIKYYPGLGRVYSVWGTVEYAGVSTSKNMLGVICLVSGVFLFWDTLLRWPEREQVHIKRTILVNVAFLVMTLWLLHRSRSLTSTICLALGCLIIAVAHSSVGNNRPGLLKVLAPTSFFLYFILAVSFGMAAQLSEAVGRNATMGDRTRIWKILLSAHTNPVLGTGYQSFWLGSRLEWFAALASGDAVQEAHNGYLAVYLELGLIGLFLICAFLTASYRTICKRLNHLTPLGSLGLAFWTILLFQDVTEQSFGGGLLWLVFLTVALTVPDRAEDYVVGVDAIGIGALEQPADFHLEMTPQGR